MNTRFVPKNRYFAALREKTADELLRAIRVGQTDADACRAQLRKDGWTDALIDAYTAPGAPVSTVTGGGY